MSADATQPPGTSESARAFFRFLIAPLQEVVVMVVAAVAVVMVMGVVEMATAVAARGVKVAGTALDNEACRRRHES